MAANRWKLRLAVASVSGLALAGVGAAYAAFPHTPATSATITKTCPAGYVLANLSWGQKCLHEGEFCKVGNVEYHAYGFDCPADGRLTDYIPSSSTTTATTTTLSTSTTTPAAPPTTSSASGDVKAPSLQEISLEMSRTVEVGDHSEHFSAVGKALTIRDGYGGWLTAVVGVRFPTADGYGQLIFFWQNAKFLGWDARYESMSVLRLKRLGPGVIGGLFPRYAVDDPACCPSLKSVWVKYRWTGHSLAASRRSPGGLGAPILVTLLP